jgi:hypothetical protein
VIHYTPLAPIVTEYEVTFDEHNEAFLKFDIHKDQPVGLRFHQLFKLRGYDPCTFLLLDTKRRTVAAGEHNEEGCFGIEQASTK